jgi:uncharacterized protein
VHPERYELVQRIANDLGLKVEELVGNVAAVERIDLRKYVGEGVGEPTLRDIVAELRKPGRDPRADFEPPKFRDDVEKLEDLQPGMQLEGVVTNVTAFGAFVDVGVHQDGLVHVSQLADRFIKDPSEVVKVGDKIKVRVVEVDLARRRIALTARSEGARPEGAAGSGRAAPAGGAGRDRNAQQRAAPSRGAQGANTRGNEGRPRPGGNAPDAQGGPKFANNPFAKLLKR